MLDPTQGPIGLVVVTYSPGDTLAALLDSIPKATERRVEVVLADNGSTDGSVEAAADRPGVRLVRTGGNLGYGGAANVGARALDPAAQAILVINPDVVLDPGSVDALLAALDRLPRAGSVGPLIVDEQGTVYPSARRLPTVGTGIGHAMFGWWWPSNPWTVAYRLDHAEPVERPAGWLSGSCLLVRRTAWDQVGGFDPAYFMYFEDVDLGDRLARAGWSNVYCPTALAAHEGGHATEREPGAMAQAHHRSAYRYLATRHPAWWQAPLRVALKWGLAGRAFLSKRSAKVAAGAELPDRRIV